MQRSSTQHAAPPPPAAAGAPRSPAVAWPPLRLTGWLDGEEAAAACGGAAADAPRVDDTLDDWLAAVLPSPDGSATACAAGALPAERAWSCVAGHGRGCSRCFPGATPRLARATFPFVSRA